MYKVCIVVLMLALVTLEANADFVFKHPGALVSQQQLRFVAAHLNEEPWKASYEAAMKSPLAALDYEPRPHATVECGPYSQPDIGCTDEIQDAQAAYLQALLWSYNGNTQHAENVRKILMAWSGQLREHTNSNARLQASWAAQLFTRAAEILKYSYAPWPQDEKYAVGHMFKTQYQPYAYAMFQPGAGHNYRSNTNWHASAIEALVNIAVYNKDEKLFFEAISRWKSVLTAYVYISTDGTRPHETPWWSRDPKDVNTAWHNPTRYIDGMPTEFCRDLPHSGYGVSALINVAETARLQGIDLYQEHAQRLTKVMETLSKYSLDLYEQKSDYSEICGKKVSGWPRGTLFIGYNHYANRLGMELPYTKAFIEQHPTYSGQVHYQWERLTHFMVTP